jgi:D-glycerate 3-kinase
MKGEDPPMVHDVVRALHDQVADARRVRSLYAPVAELVVGHVAGARARGRTSVLGIQGPQGGGKSTLATALTRAFAATGARTLAVSIDDFYLTHAEQEDLARRHPGNPYLRYRGYPGTHDVALGASTLLRLRTLAAGASVRVPVYDKSAHAGRGDRADERSWPVVTGPLDLLVVEGWMLGFTQASQDHLEPGMDTPNAALPAYEAWTCELDAFVGLDTRSPETIVRWRVDAERARRQRGESALSDDDARDYIDRFLPAYRAYVPRLRARPPCADALAFVLGDDRLPEGR